jgi:Ca-activated chloride channel homolog
MDLRRGKVYLLVSFLISMNLFAQAQVNLPGNISLNTNTHDFGDILEGNARVADFILTNNGTEEVYMLRAEVPENFIYRYSAQKILPGQSATLRLKFNPVQKGPFREEIGIFTSASGKPFSLYISGNVRFVDKSDDYACPNFNEPTEDKQVKQDFTVQVIDRATKQPIPDARVSFEPNPSIIPYHITDKNGITKNTLPVDLYDINVEARGYEPSSQTIYVGKNITSTVFLLDRVNQPVDSTIFAERNDIKPDEPQPEHRKKDSLTPKFDTTYNRIIHGIDKVFKPRERQPQNEPDIKKDTLVTIKELPGELPVSDYKPNNIVFLLDISSSMATPERLPLVKIAMKKLLYSLRSIDRVSIVTYASGTNVVLPSTTCDNKDAIAAVIDKLVAHGTTEGGKGIREAYKVANENFIKGGNNQIILATDGDFNLDRSDDALYRFIKHKAEGGIGISVVGVANIPKALKKMQEIADKGQGNFIHITNKDQAAEVLVDEIKSRSFRK